MKRHLNASPVARSVYGRGMKKKLTVVSGRGVHGYCATESNLEASAIAVFSLDPDVIRIEPQPCVFDMVSLSEYQNHEAYHAATRGRQLAKRYTPDFRLSFEGGDQVLVEIKHSRLIAKDASILSYPEKLACLGVKLCIFSEEDINPELSYNAKLLRSVARYKNKFMPFNNAPLGLRVGPALFSEYCDAGYSSEEVFSWIVSGDLKVNLSKARIGRYSNLFPSFGSKDHLRVLRYD